MVMKWADVAEEIESGYLIAGWNRGNHAGWDEYEAVEGGCK